LLPAFPVASYQVDLGRAFPDFGYRLVAETGGLPESRHSRDSARAPGQAAVFCSVSPTVDLTTVDGSSFTYAEHGSLS